MLVQYVDVFGSFVVRFGISVQAQGSKSLGMMCDSALEKVNRIGQVSSLALG